MDHLRYNTAKSIIDLHWNVYFQRISEELGYESPSALAVAHSASDLHKADQMLAVFMESATQVLIKIYIENKSSHEELTCDGFFEFMSKMDKPNVQLLQDAALK